MINGTFNDLDRAKALQQRLLSEARNDAAARAARRGNAPFPLRFKLPERPARQNLEPQRA